MPMSITNIKDEEAELTVKLDNGDLEALNEIKDSWKFSSKENALRFALAILKKSIAGGKKIYVGEGEEKVVVEPSENLLETETKSEQTP